jgi:endoglucanase
VVGADLANEPHGVASWGDGNAATDWRLATEAAGNAILAANPDWLILVQGIENYHGDSYWWGGQLEGASSDPVRLSQPDKLVYSPHDYGPTLGRQAWFRAPDFPRNLPQVWSQHWGSLLQSTPVVVGEFGGGAMGDADEDRWQRSLLTYLNERGIGSIYWAWNADSVDTDGMLEADWQTINQRQLNLVMGRLPAASAQRG